MIQCFEDFCAALNECGFSMSGGDAKGIYTVMPCSWDEVPPEGTRVRWFSEDPDIDPWEWRMRVLEERTDISYAKCFFGVGGFMTRAWAARFLAARRGGETFEEAYERGAVSHMAKRIYDEIAAAGELATHELKGRLLLQKSEKSAFDRALTELQMKMYVTIGGRSQRVSAKGEAYGWNSATYTTVERFWKTRGGALEVLNPAHAREEIAAQAMRLNPQARAADVKKLIG